MSTDSGRSGVRDRAFSYIRRRGRFTKAQERGYAALLPRYRIEPIAINALSTPLGIEIGFGMGQALIEWAVAEPDRTIIGIELYQPGIGAALDALEKGAIENVRIVDEPAQNVLAALSPHSVDEVRIFFPDPWPKKRHAKRRLIQPAFAEEVARVLAPGGRLWLATDWTPYADWMREVLSAIDALDTIRDATRGATEAGSTERSITKFERRGEGLGHEIHDLVYSRKAPTTESST